MQVIKSATTGTVGTTKVQRSVRIHALNRGFLFMDILNIEALIIEALIIEACS